MKTGKELKPGTVLRIDNDPWLVQKAEFTKSGRNSAIMKTKLKNLLTGYKTETVYGADDKLDDVILDRKEATLSFISGDSYTFMDTTDYTMYELNARTSKPFCRSSKKAWKTSAKPCSSKAVWYRLNCRPPSAVRLSTPRTLLAATPRARS